MDTDGTLRVINELENKRRWKNEYLTEIMQREIAKKAEVYRITLFQRDYQIRLEQEYNRSIDEENKEISRKQIQQRFEIKNKLGREYDMEEAEKIRRRRMEIEDSKRKHSTTLDIKHENHVNTYKNHISRLNEIVDFNQENYIKYNSAIPDRVRTYQDICYNPRLSPYSKMGVINQPSLLSISYELNKKQNLHTYDNNPVTKITQPEAIDTSNFNRNDNRLSFNRNPVSDIRVNKSYHGYPGLVNPDYLSIYDSNRRQKDYEVKVSSLPYNIVAHNNSKLLEDLYNKDKFNQISKNISVHEFNKEAIKLKEAAKLAEDQRRNLMNIERMKESEQLKRESLEQSLAKQSKQSNYKALLDFQAVSKQKVKKEEITENQRYMGPRNVSLGYSNMNSNNIVGLPQFSFKKPHLS